MGSDSAHVHPGRGVRRALSPGRPSVHRMQIRSALTAAIMLAVVALVTACEDGEGSPSTIPSATPASTTAPPPPSISPPPTTDTSAPTTTTVAPLRSLAYEKVASLDFPIIVTARPGDDSALVGQRSGLVRPLLGGSVGEPVLDISDRTTVDAERGLLGLARHPEDDTRLFVHYTDQAGDTVLSELTLGADLAVDAGSEKTLLQVDQPAANHNGGMIQFGPDGALYLGLGDGGGGGDSFGQAQDRGTLLGGLVRIDVDSGDAQLWQYGLRNPWRLWIDGDTVWIADVGQNRYEEIDVAPITESGVNYGWPIMEGSHCYEASDCDAAGLHAPIVEVERGDGGACSITGGVVYRGSDIPELEGRFLFSDYCGGFLRSVGDDGEVQDHTDDVGVPGQVVSFGVDGEGEVYVLTTGEALRLVAER